MLPRFWLFVVALVAAIIFVPMPALAEAVAPVVDSTFDYGGLVAIAVACASVVKLFLWILSQPFLKSPFEKLPPLARWILPMLLTAALTVAEGIVAGRPPLELLSAVTGALIALDVAHRAPKLAGDTAPGLRSLPIVGRLFRRRGQ